MNDATQSSSSTESTQTPALELADSAFRGRSDASETDARLRELAAEMHARNTPMALHVPIDPSEDWALQIGLWGRALPGGKGRVPVQCVSETLDGVVELALSYVRRVKS
jgi:hypothetical protein